MLKTVIKIACVLVLSFIGVTSNAQTFNVDGFRFSGNKPLKEVMTTKDELGNDVKVYQAISEGQNVIVNRVISTRHKVQITDVDAYNKRLISNYKALGVVSTYKLQGKLAIQAVENLSIEGVPVKQISISLLHNNKALTFILLTDRSSYGELLEGFKTSIKLL